MNTPQEPRPQVGVGVMIIQDGKILMGRRLGSLGYGSYGWLGGHLEHDETLQECAAREVLEETGLVVQKLTFLCVNTVVVDEKSYVDIEFVCTGFTGTPRVCEPNKVESWNWYPLIEEKLPNPLFPPCITTLQCYFQKVPNLR